MSANEDDVSPGRLFATDPAKYGSDYHAHLLEQYKIFLQLADNISERRNRANTFFLTANSFLVTTLGVADKLGSDVMSRSWWLVIAAIGGMLFALTWLLTIHSYRQMNTVKFKLIREMEQKLPVAPYDREWHEVGEGNQWSKYLPISKVDRIIPFIFIGLYAALLILGIQPNQ